MVITTNWIKFAVIDKESRVDSFTRCFAPSARKSKDTNKIKNPDIAARVFGFGLSKESYFPRVNPW